MLWAQAFVGAETTAAISPRDSNPRWCGNLRLGPPGHQHKALPDADLWVYAVGDTQDGAAPNADTMAILVQWRWKTWYPGDYSTIYYGGWTTVLTVAVPDTLYYGPAWPSDTLGGDSLGWFNDVEFRVLSTAANDSSYISVGTMRRNWK